LAAAEELVDAAARPEWHQHATKRDANQTLGVGDSWGRNGDGAADWARGELREAATGWTRLDVVERREMVACWPWLVLVLPASEEGG
jgi:hypothetical protein